MTTDSLVTGSGLTPFIDSSTPLLVRSNGKRAMTQRIDASQGKERRGRPPCSGSAGEGEDAQSVAVFVDHGQGPEAAAAHPTLGFGPRGQRRGEGPDDVGDVTQAEPVRVSGAVTNGGETGHGDEAGAQSVLVTDH